MTAVTALLLLACAAAGRLRDRRRARVAPGPVEVQILAHQRFPRQSRAAASNRSTRRAPTARSVKVPAGGVGLSRRRGEGAAPRAAAQRHRVGRRHDRRRRRWSRRLFLDEPTIEAMNLVGVEFNAVGNHEFDKGSAELLRMQTGGCAKHTTREPCAVEPFAGAGFKFLAANVAQRGRLDAVSRHRDQGFRRRSRSASSA